MRNIVMRALAVLLTAVVGACAAMPASPPECAAGRIMQRHALYFGLTTSDGAIIDEARWSAFLAETVTPRFPEGFTVLEARGQWRNRETGTIIRQPSRVLIVLAADDPVTSTAVESVRTAYRERFAQQSVLRVSAPVCASF
ncbi:DUF3574 domain-containing protein [Algiphilus sp.]|uniref:DUF3574 domain-containing protein n=1 Tax=Algiphilus sp. TaxID=1872431 RepID=UPI0025BBA8C8|nr:DUF3574 domain-containing protein [Algiphilus sp.]MCK5768743.1 DUF3574 domain-containing protein [Algiphilus sp.]